MTATKQKPRIDRRISYEHCKSAFEAVQKAYVTIKSAPPIGASRIYLDGGDELPVRLTITGINFTVDVDHASREALTPESGLRPVWMRMILELPVDPQRASEVIQRCGAMYVRRGLSPGRYFRTIRHKRYVGRAKAA